MAYYRTLLFYRVEYGGILLTGKVKRIRVKIMYKCDKCDDSATIEVEGYLYAHYLCSLHASKLAGSLGAKPNEVERMRVYA